MKREKDYRVASRAVRIRWSHLGCGRGRTVPPSAIRYRKKLLVSQKKGGNPRSSR